LLAHGRWFSPGTPASPSTKTGRYDIAEILLKVALNIKNLKKSILNVPTEKPRLLASWYIDLSQSSVNFSYYNHFVLINLSNLKPRGGSKGSLPPLKFKKNKIFWRKIVIFHTKYPKTFSAPLRSAQFF
jgi:hypothetical protein